MKASIKWSLRKVVEDAKYIRNLFFYALTRESRKEPVVRYSEKGFLLPNYERPLCFFCSYDKENIVRNDVYHYLNELVLAGFDIVFISASGAISQVDIKKLSGSCIRIINRENKGYDFYGWKTGLQEYPQYLAHKAVLLANDSVLGPLFSIKDIISSLEGYDADIIGMTDSLHFHPHLQSYFLYCKKPVIVSEEFSRFFNEVKVLEFKAAVIRRYEVGFSRRLGDRFKILALYDLERTLNEIRYSGKPRYWVEPTFDLWKSLIIEFKFPFLKKRVLTKKRVRIEEFLAVLEESGSAYNTDTIPRQ